MHCHLLGGVKCDLSARRMAKNLAKNFAWINHRCEYYKI